MAGGLEYYFSDRSGNDLAKFTASLIIASTVFIPYAGPYISVGLGSLDAAGKFDSYYNYFDKYLPPQPKKR